MPAASEYLQTRRLESGDRADRGDDANYPNGDRAIIEGAEACKDMLRTRIARSPPRAIQEPPLPEKNLTATAMLDVGRVTAVVDPPRCPFSGKARASKDEPARRSSGSEQNMQADLATVPDIEESTGQRIGGSQVGRSGMCSLCPMAKLSPRERKTRQSHCPLKFDIQGNVIGDGEGSRSAAGSVPKCPIRFLDHHSPEEMAKYFEEHKREIPRSHEVCIKRYQTNSDSIRKLDAKYGSLVGMIQGLGAKHQPFLPDTEEEVHLIGQTEKDVDTVEHWASQIGGNGVEGPALSDPNGHRQSRFDRPLKEIRVGESPSRPWGISVPIADDISLQESQADAPTKNETTHVGEDFVQNNPNHFPSSAHAPANAHHGVQEVSAARIVFNGPVFIGYPSDEASRFLKQLGRPGQSPIL